ncbi:hypothetical protein SKAU_G00161660 [Synaphobranchus kaupii]|uniref:Uncharacterized protein n=1 Tax=Synaphobranchus kaupii TaxID=118154 RepID=A0A9Q1IYY5_SYNKA|nr:hypothetical protein SKAU_G00161660 [Synaphobranchus kaupii]
MTKAAESIRISPDGVSERGLLQVTSCSVRAVLPCPTPRLAPCPDPANRSPRMRLLGSTYHRSHGSPQDIRSR